jgi:2-polyprenyl-3-methyl-5-hydroxy-6-metoxy-1,4-benzoquinol methylase
MQTTPADKDREQVELARSLIARNELSEAADMLTALVLAETPLSEAYHDLGCLAVRQGDVETAASLFELALEKNPELLPARRNIALVQAIDQHYEEALATLSPILRSGQAGAEDYGLVRDILGKAPALGAIAWARLLSDLRTPSPEQKQAIDEYQTLCQQLAAQKTANDQLRAERDELRAELRHLASTPNPETRNAAWQRIHALSDEDWQNVLIRSVDMPFYQGFPLPGFPEDSLQTGTVGSSNEPALREGFNFYRTVKGLCATHGRPLSADTRLLDFGTGWGRYSRIFMKEIAPDNITGVDVDPDLIQVCRSTFPYCNFELVPAFPPTELPAGHFDLVVAYSVFSHLSEAAATAWIEEFARILTPGGMIAITTQSRRFLAYCDNIRRTGEITHPWHLKLAESFVDLDASQAAYDRGEFLFSATGGGDARPSTFYGEALVPPAFVKRVWSRFLEPVTYIDDGRLPQALIVMRKPS